jgi:hypothetical protein
MSKNNDIFVTGRTSYVCVYKPFVGDDGKKNYSAHIIMPKKDKQIAVIEASMLAAAVDEWGAKGEAQFKQLTAAGRTCLKDGATKSQSEGDAYDGNLFISANSTVQPPALVTVAGVNVQTDEDHEYAVYSGCVACAQINIWAMDNKWGKRICATLLGLQFIRHEERLSGGGRVANISEFGLRPVEADADAPGEDF